MFYDDPEFYPFGKFSGMKKAMKRLKQEEDADKRAAEDTD